MDPPILRKCDMVQKVPRPRCMKEDDPRLKGEAKQLVWKLRGFYKADFLEMFARRTQCSGLQIEAATRPNIELDQDNGNSDNDEDDFPLRRLGAENLEDLPLHLMSQQRLAPEGRH